jgi:hypothetical protein
MAQTGIIHGKLSESRINELQRSSLTNRETRPRFQIVPRGTIGVPRHFETKKGRKASLPSAPE